MKQLTHFNDLVMKYLKVFFLLSLVLMMSCTSFAQKQTFDVVSFAFPKGWQQQKSEAGIQLSITDKKKGVYGIAVITKAKASSAPANENFNNDWDKLVKGAVTVDTAPSISDMGIETGWSCVTGQVNYVDGNNKGLATLITATGYGQTASVVIMTNTSKYQQEILAFVNSLELAKLAQVPATTNASAKSSVVGLWCDNHLETSGYSNGFAQYTAGYFRREYLFKADGTYVFRLKNWSTLMKEILFNYESGTYTIQGNQLTIIPNQGRGEWWSKKDNNASLWGSRSKTSDYKLERMNYTFEIKYYSGTANYSLILYDIKNTVRDDTYNQNGFSYAQSRTGKSIIDNLPGFKICL
jgi:hypothetical protein